MQTKSLSKRLFIANQTLSKKTAAGQLIRIKPLVLAMLPLFWVSAGHTATQDTQAVAPNTDVQIEDDADVPTTVLDTITVTASTSPFAALTNDQIDGDARLKMLGETDTFSAPISVVSYDEAIINDQQTRTTTDMLAKNDASVTALGGEAYVLDGIAVRGSRIDTREFSLNGLAGLFAGYQSSTAYVSRAELIKGASGGLGGGTPESAVGGAVNIETKKAEMTDLNRVGVGWFSDSRIQNTVDVSRRFGEDKEWGVRVNGLYRNGDSARDEQSEENSTIALNTDYYGERLSAQLDVIHNNRNNNAMRARMDNLQNLDFAIPDAPDGSTNLAEPWTWQDSEETIVALTGEYYVNDDLTLSGGIGHNEAEMQQLFSQLEMLNSEGDYRERTVRTYDFTIDTTSANMGLNGYAETGNVSHNWAASVDYTHRNRSNANNNATAESIGVTNNIYDVDYYDSPTAVSYDWDGRTINTNNNLSFGLSDTLGFFDDTLKVTGGVRYQQLEQKSKTEGVQSSRYDEDALNPMLAVVWEPQNDFVLYANYMQDLQPGDVVDDADALNDGTSLSPYESEQYEIGVRKDWGNVAATAALYQIDSPVAYFKESTQRYDAYGNVRNRGAELNVYGTFLDGTLRPGVGVTYIDAQLQDQEEDSYNGNQMVATPEFIAKARIEWDTPWVEGLTLKANAQHYGNSYQDAANEYEIDGYTLFDVGARYDTKLWGKEVSFNTTVENVTDENYWLTHTAAGGTRSYAILGMPRTAWVSATFDF